MKNPTILKDELSILRADKSSVLTELRSLGEQLKEKQKEIEVARQTLADVKDKTSLETARRDEIRDRAVFLESQISSLTEEYKEIQKKTESARTKNALEQRLHLGRIKELEQEKKDVQSEINSLKNTYDKNQKALANNYSDLTARYRDTNEKYKEVEKEYKRLSKEITNLEEQERKATKERLKREDKIRSREKALEKREQEQDKRQESLEEMASDLLIIYSRLREKNPDVEIDKLINKAV